MDVLEVLKEFKNPIERAMRDFFGEKSNALKEVNSWGEDVQKKLLDFSLHGKMIRGGLILLSYGMFGGAEKPLPWVVRVAAAYELIHSSLLIHDDIMDRDDLRRGRRTIFSQYADLGRGEGVEEAGHLGESLGICAGDIGFFLAFEMLADAGRTSSSGKIVRGAASKSPDLPGAAEPDSELIRRIFRLWSSELTAVGIAQMQDVALGHLPREPDETEVLSLYRHKTARYTFSTPFVTGALAAGRNGETLERLAELGEHLGVIFQIKDDELGIFGTEKEIGKPVASDLREGKKTLLSLLLEKKCGEEYREAVGRILEAEERSTHAALVSLKGLATASGVLGEIHSICGELEAKAERIIGRLDIGEESKAAFRGLFAYNLERKR